MEIKRTEKAFQISETQNSETNSASSKKVSTFSTSDSFENAGANQSMFAAPQPQSPLNKALESLEKQFDAIRFGQSMISTASPQTASRANDKQAEFTKAHIEFKEEEDARIQEQMHQAAENAFGNQSTVLGDSFTPIWPDFLDNDTPATNTPTEKPKPEPIMKFETNQKQKYFNDLLESNRLKPTSSVEDERTKNVKDHNNVPSFYPPTEPTSRANDRQAEFTEAKAEFEKSSNQTEGSELAIDLDDYTHSGFDDPVIDLGSLPNHTATISESNRKQKELSDLFTSNKETLEEK
ncbi:MAG TPA: hypothetical protein VH815_04345 [Acidobacteriota bacterium]